MANEAGGNKAVSDPRRGSKVAANSDVARRLTDICGPGYARAAGPADDVATAMPRWVAAPPTVAAVAEVLRLSAEHDLALVPRGSGSKMHWGATPSHVDIVLDTARLAGVWHHPPDAATAQVGAGTPLRKAQAAVGRKGWRLPFDPPSAGATVGGVVAADEAGPMSYGHGSPCRHLIGVNYVDASGTLVRTTPDTSDGREVSRLLCGSQGALAVLVSATVRLQPEPADRLWVRRSVRTPLEVHDLVAESTVAGLRAAAIELDLPGAEPPPRRGPLRPGLLAMLFEGDATQTRRRAQRAADLLGADASVTDQPPTWWQRYPFAAGDIAIRLEVPVAHLHAAIYALVDAARAPIPVRGAVATGLVHAVLPGSTPPHRVEEILVGVRTVLLARGGSCRVLSAPAAVRRVIDIWGDVPGLPRLRELKQRFDPHHRLAPGRFTGGL
ncbi:FAD-binding oxidoreductase [Solwaraspora sp. WMMD406]|uniref:FAD-binding oxidoreductase n=1 Tax=Solwaraspora sp. WMMD406 TaxID=3016095 RepID=UPI002417AF93|nr:FAD-binding oxidoreductase [Solwaraspora sp. WMMD406]MDG4763237.1 FAD-binding oxidoreductase [Solwaraspora sp. WMMD406]